MKLESQCRSMQRNGNKDGNKWQQTCSKLLAVTQILALKVCIGLVVLLLGAGLLEVSDSQQRTALERLRIGCPMSLCGAIFFVVFDGATAEVDDMGTDQHLKPGGLYRILDDFR